MGLLAKANFFLARKKPPGGENPEFLDEKGLALRDRIRRLSAKKASPYIALGLMKNYGPFRAGVCLSRKDNYYSGYTSVGLGLGNLDVPEDEIFSPSFASKKYFRLEAGSFHLGISSLNPADALWIFPLDKNTPWDAVLLLAAAKSSAFNPERFYSLLSGILDIINPEENPLEAALIRYHEENPSFSGILTSASESMNSEEQNYFLEKLARMVSLLGKVIPVSGRSAGKNLILIPRSMDRGLIAHRLDATLPISIPLAFDAESPGEALDKLKPFL